MSEVTELEEVEFESRLNTAPAARRTPSDLLAERRNFMRRFTTQAGLETPTIEQLKKHADKYGTEQVVETAVELGYGLDTIVNLMDYCDRVNATNYRKERPYAKAQKIKSSEERAKALLGIKDEDESDNGS